MNHVFNKYWLRSGKLMNIFAKNIVFVAKRMDGQICNIFIFLIYKKMKISLNILKYLQIWAPGTVIIL